MGSFLTYVGGLPGQFDHYYVTDCLGIRGTMLAGGNLSLPLHASLHRQLSI
jgi:hypothetical protein